MDSLPEARKQLKTDLEALVEMSRRIEEVMEYLTTQMVEADRMAEAMESLSFLDDDHPRPVRSQLPPTRFTIPPNPPPSEDDRRPKRGVPRGTIRSPKTAAILEIVREAAGPVSPSEVKAELDKMNMPLTPSGVTQVLGRLPQIEKIGRGRYRYKG